MGATLPTEDARVAQARKALIAARAAVEDYSTPYAPQVRAARLDVALETLLGYVDETGPGGQLDRVERHVEKIARTLVTAVNAEADDEPIARAPQLDRIEERIGRIESILSAELETLGRVLGGETDRETGQ